MNSRPDLVCFAHLRWAFVFQRPNHLMVRFARDRRVFYIEEPLFDSPAALHEEPHMQTLQVEGGVWVCTPHLPSGAAAGKPTEASEAVLERLVAAFLREHDVQDPLLWFYTPMALPLARSLRSSVMIYDCMDELSLFLGAPKELLAREQELFKTADLVFTGGHSLYEAKRNHHPAVHAFPSSVDIAHFRAPNAAAVAQDPADQAEIPHPRVGFYGVIDERMDVDLLQHVASQRPTYQFVIVGPVVKISEDALPRAGNIHFLGPKAYAELPAYLHGWDVAMMPFALNESTRFISPTKTLEYLAADKPVVSTAVRDVVSPYGERGLVSIADSNSFAQALDDALASTPSQNHERAARALAGTSWDATFQGMSKLIEDLSSRDDLPQARLADKTQPTVENQGEFACSIT